jgi:hypothetical protein
MSLIPISINRNKKFDNNDNHQEQQQPNEKKKKTVYYGIKIQLQHKTSSADLHTQIKSA